MCQINTLLKQILMLMLLGFWGFFLPTNWSVLILLFEDQMDFSVQVIQKSIWL